MLIAKSSRARIEFLMLKICAVIIVSGFVFVGMAQAEDFVITLKGTQFSPVELSVPAGQKIKITVKNLNDSPAEFECSALNREKIVTPHGEITLFIGPLDAGHYDYVNDFDHTIKGVITAK